MSAALLAPLALPSAALAAPPDNPPHDKRTGATQEKIRETLPLEVNTECGFPIEVRATDKVFSGRPVRDGLGQAVSGHDTYRFQATHTNTVTGESLRLRVQGLFHEKTARLLENYQPPESLQVPVDERTGDSLDGPYYEFTPMIAQHVTIWGPDGKRVSSERGPVPGPGHLQHLGDAQPGGDVVEELEFTIVSGVEPFADFDCCALARDLIGP